MTEPPVSQYFKTRDDRKPARFLRDPTNADKPFTLHPSDQCAWLPGTQSFGAETLRSRIEPWLTALCQSEHMSLLLGSGLTHAVHGLAVGAGLPGMGNASFSAYSGEIFVAAMRSAVAAGREKCNIEDQIRTALELLRGLEILGDREGSPSAADLREEVARVLKEFGASILAGEAGLLTANQTKREEAFNYLVSFLMSFASRSGTRDRLHIFTTNYDRFIEAGAEAAGLHLLDRFVGSLAPVFRASRLDLDLHYNPPGIRGEPRYLEGVARYTKLHGSVDWVDVDGSIRRLGVPLGATDLAPFLAAARVDGVDELAMMIYPNAAKDRETAEYPYVELFRDLASAVCRPNHTLVCYGYSFGDEHINRILEDMLTIPSTHLVIIAYGDPLGRILGFYDKVGRPAQTTLLVGDHVGDLKTLVDNYLPKPAIDKTTFRMSELLKARWGTKERSSETGESATAPVAGEATE